MGLFGNLFGSSKKAETTASSPAKDSAAAVQGLVKDLVCGMDIDPRTAAGKSEYMGKTYYFCAPGCKSAFDKNPAKYLSGNAPKPISGG